jgi:hypothetical protein
MEAPSQPWRGRSPDPTKVLEGVSEPHWPWLRPPTNEVPGFRLNPDGSVRTDEQASNVRRMSGELAPLEQQQEPDAVAGGNGVTSSNVAPSPPIGASAMSVALPASAGVAGDIGALVERGVSTLVGAAARAAPSAAGAGAAVAGALPFLLYPTNTQSETTDLGDGLRARIRPGQRTVEIERRVDNGLLGTGIMAKWETLPVEAWQHVGKDGSVNTVINHEQLNRALGRAAPAESKTAARARWRNRRRTVSRSNRRHLLPAPA